MKRLLIVLALLGAFATLPSAAQAGGCHRCRAPYGAYSGGAYVTPYYYGGYYSSAYRWGGYYPYGAYYGGGMGSGYPGYGATWGFGFGGF